MEVWNIRGFMILSLSMKLILAFAAPLQQKTSNFIVISVVWLAYFLADWTTVFVFGWISNAGCSKSPSYIEFAEDLLAQWASFLFIHLCSLDTITAFSLEDNGLWLCHLVGLIGQVIAFLNILVKTLPDNNLMAPTIVVFAMGVIKYGERTRALYLPSLGNFKESLIKLSKQPDGINLASAGSDEEANSYEKPEREFHFFQIFKGMIVNVIPNHSQWLKIREFFLKQDSDSAFMMIATGKR